jgi:hypothetical protein
MTVQNLKPIIIEVGRILAQHYGFTDEELDFIANCDIRCRLGWEGVMETTGFSAPRRWAIMAVWAPT